MAAIEMGPEDRLIDLVFCHANGFNALTYRHLLAPVAEAGHRILAIDMRGHGRSELAADPGDGHGSWLGYRDDLIGLLETLEAPPRVVAGHSMGGTSGVLASGPRPDLVPALVLFDPVLMDPAMVDSLGPEGLKNSPLAQGARRRRAEFDSREAAFAGWQGRGAFRAWSDAVLADYITDGLIEQPDGRLRLACAPAWESANFAAHFHNPWSALAEGTCPIHMLRAAEGSTANIADRLDDQIAAGRIRVETIPGTSHFLPMERPDLFSAALLEALL
ncbi:MAG: alpha/beta hydrolase [Caulobacter sp.]|nr:alpha/beta hydrolase [Caulobacter sp.]